MVNDFEIQEFMWLKVYRVDTIPCSNFAKML